METSPIESLQKLRAPFPANCISKLPKPTKQQTDEVKADYKKGVRCEICGGWHHPKVVHLDYVGHAALTDRLLDADPAWIWEPVAFDQNGLPLLDKDGGLWIKLTVCNVTRFGYGDAQGKTGGDAMKERIGDALRNAAMRFGAALDLWHKGDLHTDSDEEKGKNQDTDKKGSSYWCLLADKNVQSPKELSNWYVTVVSEAKRTMDEKQFAKFYGYVADLGKSLKEQPVDCPEGKGKVSEKSCENLACRQGCPVFE